MNRPNARQVLECASPLALWCAWQSGGGLPHSKTLSRGHEALESSWPQGAPKKASRLSMNRTIGQTSRLPSPSFDPLRLPPSRDRQGRRDACPTLEPGSWSQCIRKMKEGLP